MAKRMEGTGCLFVIEYQRYCSNVYCCFSQRLYTSEMVGDVLCEEEMSVSNWWWPS